MSPATESPRLGQQPFQNEGDLAVSARDDDAHQAAKTCESSANALNSKGVSRRVEQEHRPLLTGLPLEADMGLDDELDIRGSQAIGEFVELRDRQDQAEVRDRDVVSVDRIVDLLRPAGRQVRDHLVAVQVPVHPGVCAAALPEAEHFAVEAAGGGQVVDGHRQMESREGGVKNGHVSIVPARVSSRKTSYPPARLSNSCSTKGLACG